MNEEEIEKEEFRQSLEDMSRLPIIESIKFLGRNALDVKNEINSKEPLRILINGGHISHFLQAF